jgi:hypothetical protein
MTIIEYDPRVTPWQIDEDDFYEIESFRDQAAFLLRYAVLAPSSHNRQPWIFRVVENGIEVYADYSRRLASTDSSDRELLMSVGAAIMNLRVAAAWFGFDTTVTYQQRHESSVPVAFVALRETSAPDEELRMLFPLIRRRHTNRKPFTDEALEPEAVSAICDVLDRYPDTLRLVPWHDGQWLANLVTTGEKMLMARPGVRAELADWLAPTDGERSDGICLDTLGIPGPFTAVNWTLRNLDLGTLLAWRAEHVIENAAAVLVVTAANDRLSLIQAGETLERVLLTLTRYNVAAAFINQPIQVPGLRRSVQNLVRSPLPAQLLLCVGRPARTERPAPRRTLESVLVP